MIRKAIHLTLAASLVRGELLQIMNNGNNELIVSVTGLEHFVVAPGKTVPVTVPDNFTGSVTAVPTDLENVVVPRTKIELTLSPVVDAYDVSLLDGFNVKAKITPLQGRRCKSVGCSVDINPICSTRNQVRDNQSVIACYNAPFLFKAVCPKAVVTTADVRNVFSCSSDTYSIILG